MSHDLTALYERLSHDDEFQSRKIQFSKGIVRCIIKAVEEGDIFEYNGADTSTGLRASEITPIYG